MRIGHDTTVREALLTVATTHGPELTVAQAREAFANPKVHMLLVTRSGRLLGTLVRSDLTAWADGMALTWARLAGRTVSLDESADDVRREMIAAGQRRRAVVDADGRLLGLLCLKRHQRDFCSDADVAARRAERAALR